MFYRVSGKRNKTGERRKADKNGRRARESRCLWERKRGDEERGEGREPNETFFSRQEILNLHSTTDLGHTDSCVNHYHSANAFWRTTGREHVFDRLDENLSEDSHSSSSSSKNSNFCPLLSLDPALLADASSAHSFLAAVSHGGGGNGGGRSDKATAVMAGRPGE